MECKKILEDWDVLSKASVNNLRNADLYMDDFKYVDGDKIQVDAGDEAGRPEEKALDIPESIMDQIRLVSTYKGVPVPSMIFDSRI